MNFDHETRAMLRSVLVEAWGGFAANRFPTPRRADAKTLIDRLDQDSKLLLSPDDETLFKEALTFALKELGPEEFQTITGYDFGFGESVLAKLR